MSGERCPACGSDAVGVGETFGDGPLRFRPVCGDCRETTSQAWGSIQEAFDANHEWFHGGAAAGIKVDDTLRMVSGEKRAPSVGELRLDGIAASAGAEVRTDVFRDETESARYEAGQPVVKLYICEGCRSQQGGAEIKGGFYAAPAGWYLQHPSARLFCSVECVNRERNGDG